MTEPWNDSLVTHRYADLGDVRLHYVEAGAGPLVVLLHGFPEFWYAWRHQIPALVAAGFRVVAPDLRGYNLSDKPAGVAAYGLDALTGDVAALIRHCGEERATVVAHDWGGGIAWAFAMRYPDMTRRLAILNAPHPLRLIQGLRTRRQLAKSWYMFFFQLPWLPERLMARKDYLRLRTTLREDPARPGAFSEDDIDRYVEAAARPGALTATINYYRAAMRRDPRRMIREMRPVACPVLVIWGQKDRYLEPDLVEPPAHLVSHARVEYIPEASHWVQADAPDRVNELLVAFFREDAAQPTPHAVAVPDSNP